MKFGSEEKRSLSQNDHLWAALRDISRQLRWPVDGVEQQLPPEDWKVILTAGIKRENRIAAGVNGGFVILGTPTSRMTKAEMSELLDFIHFFASERGVVLSGEVNA